MKSRISRAVGVQLSVSSDWCAAAIFSVRAAPKSKNMNNLPLRLLVLAISLTALITAGCSKPEVKQYGGKLHVANIPKNSIYAVAQFDVDAVDANVAAIGKTDRELTLSGKQAVRLGDCEFPIKYYIESDTNNGRFGQCSRKTAAGALEPRNIDGGKVVTKGGQITIEIRIDDFYYTFNGEEKK